MTKTAEQIVMDAGDILEDLVRGLVNDVADDYSRVESDGIGFYEYAGQRCYDAGSDWLEFTGFALAVRLNAAILAEIAADPESEPTEIVGTFSGQLPDGFGEARWEARPLSVEEGAEGTWAIYEVEEE